MGAWVDLNIDLSSGTPSGTIYTMNVSPQPARPGTGGRRAKNGRHARGRCLAGVLAQRAGNFSHVVAGPPGTFAHDRESAYLEPPRQGSQQADPNRQPNQRGLFVGVAAVSFRGVRPSTPAAAQAPGAASVVGPTTPAATQRTGLAALLTRSRPQSWHVRARASLRKPARCGRATCVCVCGSPWSSVEWWA